MIDREKVIKALECCLKESDHLYSNPCNGCPYEGQECIDRMKTDALALLKEHEAVKPILIREGRNKENHYYECRECGEEIVFEQKYCSGCGKPIKWD